jgi:hypothetical protein
LDSYQSTPFVRRWCGPYALSGHTLEKALYTNMPINLRKPGEVSSGNKITIALVELAHGKKDPYLRMRQIVENHRIIKRTTRLSQPSAFTYYIIVIQSFSMLFEVLIDRFEPVAP